ncbi:MAG: hypothetical protein JJ966_12580 [Balneolaceae bacterium]|nr:hypothetical protein [Balneolaceae bacterium]
MKTSFSLLFIFAFVSATAFGQFRSDLPGYYDYTGPLINERAPTVQNGLDRFFSKVEMKHSYSMSFNSFGGSYQNVNAYTNTLLFDISPRMNARVDVSFLHSPFGGSQSINGMNNFQNQVLIRNAELNYKISDKAFIQIQYQQLPRGFGYGYSPYGYNPFGYSRYDRFRSNSFWY